MDNLKYFPFYYARFSDGVRGYDMEFVGIYMMLICRQAEIGRIEKDLLKVSRWMGGVSVEKIENVLSEKFECDEYGFFNIVLVEVLEEVAKKSVSARNSVNKRWEKIRTQYERNTNVSETYAKSDTNDILIKESKVNKRKRKESKEKKVFIPPQLLEVIDYFKENGFSEELATRAFKGYSEADWHDSKGNKVLNWKQKMINVWFKPENNINHNGKPKSSGAATAEQIAAWASKPITKLDLGDFSGFRQPKDTGNGTTG